MRNWLSQTTATLKAFRLPTTQRCAPPDVALGADIIVGRIGCPLPDIAWRGCRFGNWNHFPQTRSPSMNQFHQTVGAYQRWHRSSLYGHRRRRSLVEDISGVTRLWCLGCVITKICLSPEVLVTPSCTPLPFTQKPPAGSMGRCVRDGFRSTETLVCASGIRILLAAKSFRPDGGCH